MYNKDQWKVMELLASDLPKRVTLRVKQIATKFRNRENPDRTARNAFRKLRAEGHIEIVERGEYRLTPSGVKFYNKMIAEGYKPSAKRAVSKKTAKKATKKAKTAKKVAKKAPAKAKTAKKTTTKKKAVAKKTTKTKTAKSKAAKKPMSRKDKIKDAFKSAAQTKKTAEKKEEASSNGNGVSEKAAAAPAATANLTW